MLKNIQYNRDKFLGKHRLVDDQKSLSQGRSKSLSKESSKQKLK